ncbi:uncharacterized protein PAC_06464 [Phialocephala subalpina]|uniref:Membrane insertase YidC/Oxa/ALB C-terminal domain-containing protein n=1 Tax=Phialocephala subalpina TaxID=576137 RepID=A0A1L7WUW8_9HELO|nr:uncharacterized protein PAC_06464 [Phialocephala subalpina]
MIPSRGLRWSSQAISIGRRRLDTVSARQFSSSVHHGPIRANPLLSKSITSLRTTRIPSRTSSIILNGVGVRFASTTPAPITPLPTTPMATPAEAVSSSAASTPITEYTSSLDSATEFGTESLYNIPEGIGYLKALGLDYGYGPTALMEWTLEHIHIYAGTPWWVSIALTAIVARAILFKPYINAAENSARMAAIMPLTTPITAKMQAASRMGDTDLAMQMRGELQRLHKRAGVKVWKSFVPMLQVIAGYGTFVILRAMSRLPVPGLETGGILWFQNLTIPDPIWVIPIATAGVLHWVLRKGGETGVSNMQPQVLKAMMWGLPLLSFLFTFWLPAALQWSFFVAGLCSFSQATALRQPWFRNYFNMSPLPKPKSPADQPPTPYQGKLKIAAKPVLSQAELNSRFQGAQATAPQSQTIEEIKKMSPPKSPISKIVGQITTPVTEIRDAGKGMWQKAEDYMETKKEKNDVQAAKKYEEKRQAEERQRRGELTRRRKEEWAARKRQDL